MLISKEDDICSNSMKLLEICLFYVPIKRGSRIQNVTVYDDYFVICFKSGIEIKV